jgi:hypothetical protein
VKEEKVMSQAEREFPSQPTGPYSIQYKYHARYPECRHDYTLNVAIISEFAINVAFQDLGYSVSLSHHPNANGVDIELDSETGVEVWNFCQPHSYETKIESVKKNLSQYKYRYLITSFISQPLKAEFEQNGITVILTGFQLLVDNEQYQSFYGVTENRDYFSAKTVIALKQILLPYFPPIIHNPTVRCIASDYEENTAYVYASTITTDILVIYWLIQRKISKLQYGVNKIASKIGGS